MRSSLTTRSLRSLVEGLRANRSIECGDVFFTIRRLDTVVPHLVRKVEFVWLVDAFEPAKTSDLGEILPIDDRSAYFRLRHLYRSGYLNRSEASEGHTQSYAWSLTKEGREWLIEQDMPDIEDIDLDEYFSGRTDKINPLSILEAFAAKDGEWHRSSVAYEALPFTKQGIRYNLHKLHEQGDLELDANENGYSYRWRLTEQGRSRLAEAKENETENIGEYIWLDS